MLIKYSTRDRNRNLVFKCARWSSSAFDIQENANTFDVGLVEELRKREVGLRVLSGTDAQIDTTMANGRTSLWHFHGLSLI